MTINKQPNSAVRDLQSRTFSFGFAIQVYKIKQV
jgi:hypothetical protein